VDKELLTENIQIEKKQFWFDLRENPRGRFLRITEDNGRRENNVIIPAGGLELVREIIDRALQAEKESGARLELEGDQS